mmetsp:Transcript_10828/g.24221  ORF Transcript_10828/g.24221 Transcript_10828/m.24221 type:complete len:83 (+) Transcript_10828:232-480(+)
MPRGLGALALRGSTAGGRVIGSDFDCLLAGGICAVIVSFICESLKTVRAIATQRTERFLLRKQRVSSSIGLRKHVPQQQLLA